MAEAPCLSTGARLTDLPNESYRALWAPSCASEKKAPTRKPPPPPLMQCCFGVGGVGRISFVRHAASAITSWTQLCRGGAGRGGGFFFALPGLGIPIPLRFRNFFFVWRRWSDSSGEHSCLSAPRDQVRLRTSSALLAQAHCRTACKACAFCSSSTSYIESAHSCARLCRNVQ